MLSNILPLYQKSFIIVARNMIARKPGTVYIDIYENVIFIAYSNPNGFKSFKMVFRKEGFRFEDNFDAVMGLINADMLEHDAEMLSKINIALKKIHY